MSATTARAPIPAAVTLGIYEKALRWTGEWRSFFDQAVEAGFSFVDISVDETPERAARLDWDDAQCAEVREAAAAAGVQIGGICLSLHRRIMPGSADPAIREEAYQVYLKGIDLCRRLGVSVLQVAGYFAYYEDDDPDARSRYVDTLARALPYAAQAGIILGIENVDGHDIASIPDAMAVLDECPSAWLQVYPDVGNIAEHGGDARTELAAGENHMVAIHVKDVLPGQPRRIPLGEGVADFAGAFAELARQGWCGRMMIEMWNDEAADSAARCADARAIVASWLDEAGIDVVPPSRKR
ncbi:L-ribulose-5-phosphate 3-epimerase [Nanchangia anserum]|uniref:L-ribulose-5-phosphate 3-epimerase n=1 Tax=Nanchangia anserum TaxID=2692125 RepID=A0A8I0G897_9ACTO|nr:L-ribulose-5-phosphate 3-epimerase [Nanchangia anserum]MBD3689687.1 L-ribulose-5-phosphate 3-epimerase [Nanchangia anserum]QOX81864.1 L-ribulose-5-phosphate 3-epimerase [Nanchangia anserum]